ncbi:MAG: hypothetical protein H0X37_11265 [Herpetosiphonaceae bacterium]|nr:hypothetical protein [Herpetosiphonaceae bacterium]
MPMWAKRSIGLLLIWAAVGVIPSLARSQDAIPETVTLTADLGIKHLANGAVTLASSTPLPPRPYTIYTRYGLADSTVMSSDTPITGVDVTWTSTVPSGSELIVMVRGRMTNGHWGTWNDDVVAGTPIAFDMPVQAVQARAILLGSSTAAPVIRNLHLQPTTAGLTAMSVYHKAAQVAPTYRLRVTREGLVGSHTANGHRIRPNDVYVSLPSWSSLSSLGGHEYEVRLSANGKSIVAPVWDVGPWNHHDNFWDTKRKTYSDLPAGWPEDHAAYYEHYNGRMAEEGWVRFPTAVDIGDGAYWALGLDGEQAVVNVSFLWLGDDPGRNAKPLNRDPAHRPTRAVATAEVSAPEITPSEQAAKPLEQVEVAAVAGPQFDANTSAWHTETCRDAAPARWLAGYPLSVRSALWRPQLAGGMYDVLVHVPLCAGLRPTTQAASYLVHIADGTEQSVTINQATAPDQWVSLGRFPFAAGSADFVKLTATASQAGYAVWFDRIRWQQVAN